MVRPEPIVVRPYRPDDASGLFEAAVESVEQVCRWLPWCHPGYTLQESRAWIAHSVAAWDSGAEYNFAVVDHANRFLGGCGLNQVRLEHRNANLGYWVRTSATRQGIATAAVQEVARCAFSQTNLVRLEIIVAIDNMASQRVAEKVGALREGIAHDRLWLNGTSCDAVVYALLRSRIRIPVSREG